MFGILRYRKRLLLAGIACAAFCSIGFSPAHAASEWSVQSLQSSPYYAQGAQLANSAWNNATKMAESTGNYQAGEQSGSGAAGAYQLTPGAIVDSGIATKINPQGPASWDNISFRPNAYGIHDLNSFLNSPSGQDAIEQGYLTNAVVPASEKIESEGLAAKNGLDPGAVDSCVYVGGGAGCTSLLTTGSTGIGRGTTTATVDAEVKARELQGSHYSTTSADGTDQNPNAPQVPFVPGNPNGVGIYCDPAVAKALATDGVTTVNKWRALAMQPGTGYTLMSGESVLQAAGLEPDNTPLDSNTAGLNYAQASCLGNLLNGGLNVLFEPPNLNEILGSIENAACNKIQGMMQQVTQPLSQSLYEGMDTDGFLPGFGLGSIGGGINTNVSGQPGVIYQGPTSFQQLLSDGSSDDIGAGTEAGYGQFLAPAQTQTTGIVGTVTDFVKGL